MGYSKAEAVGLDIISITPEMASKMLENNRGNRILRKALVSKYAKEMKAGNWVTTHQGIAVNSIGGILDGQHRLAAIVESGKTISLMVTKYSGETEALKLPIDRSAPRTSADITQISKGDVAVYSIILAYVKNVKFSSEVDLINLNDKVAGKKEFLNSISSLRTRYVTIAAVIAGYFIAYLDGKDERKEYRNLSLLNLTEVKKETLELYAHLMRVKTNGIHGQKGRREILIRSYLAATGRGCKRLTETHKDYMLEEMKDILEREGI